MKGIVLRRRWIINSIISILFSILLLIFIVNIGWAGQVVTKKVRLWAREVLEKEKALETVSSPNTLAVLYYFNKTGQKELIPVQKGLALMLITDLVKVRGIQVVERVKIQALLDEMHLGISGLVDPETVPRMSKLLKAQWILGGEIGKTQVSLIQINSNFLDVPAQEIIKQIEVKGELAELIDLEKEILFNLIKVLKIELTPVEKEELQKPLSTNINALMALFKAIEASDNQNYQEAADYCEEALKIDPKIGIAESFLKEIKNLELISVKKPVDMFLKSLKNNTSLTDQIIHEEATKRKLSPTDAQQRKIILRDAMEEYLQNQNWQSEVINQEVE